VDFVGSFFSPLGKMISSDSRKAFLSVAIPKPNDADFLKPQSVRVGKRHIANFSEAAKILSTRRDLLFDLF